MVVRLGDLLVRQGLLTPDQRDEVLDEQTRRARPFGVLAEELFGLSPHSVEQAWAEQYAMLAQRIDPRAEEPAREVLALIERRQAWQFGVIPVRCDQDELILVTATEHLARAMRFAGWRLPMRCTFAICPTEQLATALGIHYPIEGFDAAFIAQVMGQFARAG